MTSFGGASLGVLRSLGVLLTAVAGCGGNAATGTSLGDLPPPAMCTDASVIATEANSVASVGENVDTTCASVVRLFTWKVDATGTACTSPLDCTPVCCPCPDGKHHTLAAWCNQGQCASADAVACMVAGSPLKSCGN